MKYQQNRLNQPVGATVDYWKMPLAPKREIMVGHYCRLEPLELERHAESLFDANALEVEGVFRQVGVAKGRNRDTAWYAAIDLEWPAINNAISQWLKSSNFDELGQQRTRLSVLTAPILNKNLVDDDL